MTECSLQTGTMAEDQGVTPFEEKPKDCWITTQPIVDLMMAVWGREPDLDPFWDPASLFASRRRLDIREGDDAYRDAVTMAKLAARSTWRVFCNGPYSGQNPQRTAELCVRLRALGHTVWNLCPAAPGSGYWDRWVWPHATAIAWLGRWSFMAGRDLLFPEGHKRAGEVQHKAGTIVHGNRTEIALIDYSNDPEPFAHLVRVLLGKHTEIRRRS